MSPSYELVQLLLSQEKGGGQEAQDRGAPGHRDWHRGDPAWPEGRRGGGEQGDRRQEAQVLQFGADQEKVGTFVLVSSIIILTHSILQGHFLLPN